MASLINTQCPAIGTGRGLIELYRMPYPKVRLYLIALVRGACRGPFLGFGSKSIEREAALL